MFTDLAKIFVELTQCEVRVQLRRFLSSALALETSSICVSSLKNNLDSKEGARYLDEVISYLLPLCSDSLLPVSIHCFEFCLSYSVYRSREDVRSFLKTLGTNPDSSFFFRNLLSNSKISSELISALLAVSVGESWSDAEKSEEKASLCEIASSISTQCSQSLVVSESSELRNKIFDLCLSVIRLTGLKSRKHSKSIRLSEDELERREIEQSLRFFVQLILTSHLLKSLLCSSKFWNIFSSDGPDLFAPVHVQMENFRLASQVQMFRRFSVVQQFYSNPICQDLLDWLREEVGSAEITGFISSIIKFIENPQNEMLLTQLRITPMTIHPRLLETICSEKLWKLMIDPQTIKDLGSGKFSLMIVKYPIATLQKYAVSQWHKADSARKKAVGKIKSFLSFVSWRSNRHDVPETQPREEDSESPDIDSAQFDKSDDRIRFRAVVIFLSVFSRLWEWILGFPRGIGNPNLSRL